MLKERISTPFLELCEALSVFRSGALKVLYIRHYKFFLTSQSSICISFFLERPSLSGVNETIYTRVIAPFSLKADVFHLVKTIVATFFSNQNQT